MQPAPSMEVVLARLGPCRIPFLYFSQRHFIPWPYDRLSCSSTRQRLVLRINRFQLDTNETWE